MTDDHRPPGADIVDIRFAVHVIDPAALGPVDENRGPPDRLKSPNRAVNAAGNQLLGRFK
jgi:hypothetical protein